MTFGLAAVWPRVLMQSKKLRAWAETSRPSVGRLADSVIFVARIGQTTVDATVALHKRFWEDHTRILGTILNDWNPKSAVNGYYGAASYAAYQNRYGG